MFRILFSATLSVSKREWFPSYRVVDRHRLLSYLYHSVLLLMKPMSEYSLLAMSIFRKRIYRSGAIYICPVLMRHLTHDGS